MHTNTNALPTLSGLQQSYFTSRDLCWMGYSTEISTWALELEQLLTDYKLQAKYAPPPLFTEGKLLLEQRNGLCSHSKMTDKKEYCVVPFI